MTTEHTGEANAAADDRMSILARRRIEANIIAPIYEIMVRELGAQRAGEIINEAVEKDARAAGSRFAAQEPNGANLTTFIAIQDLWRQDGALEVETMESTADTYTFRVRKCSYSQMYKDMGLAEIGKYLSCTRDKEFIAGYDPAIELTRTQTLMEGADYCDFHFTRKQ